MPLKSPRHAPAEQRRRSFAVEVAREIKGLIERAGKLVGDPDIKVAPAPNERLVRIRDVGRLDGGADTDPLAHFKPKERAQYQRMFELIY